MITSIEISKGDMYTIVADIVGNVVVLDQKLEILT